MNTVPLFIGLGLGGAIALFARQMRFDQDRSFYPTVLIVIASYYVLFAVMSGAPIVVELVVAGIFSALAIAGAHYRVPLAGWGILLHGIFDFTRVGLIGDGGAPLWWPAFCGGIDVVLGLWLLAPSYLSKPDVRA
tara:strand:- start:71 stop:475 length:405 start_codon:yes stop_codon:yes gene_type:complete